MTLQKCRECGAWIQTDFGADEPAAHTEATGEKDDPKAPGDWDDICDICCWG